MLQPLFEKHRIILASASPRRQQLLSEMGVPFEVIIKPTDESYPAELSGSEIPEYIARKKAKPFHNLLNTNDILITSDTVVFSKNRILGKPADEREAVEMLGLLSDDEHRVMTSLCLTTAKWQECVTDITTVQFRKLTDEEINYYVKTHKPYDKAGAYGIQDWIGQIGIMNISGTYNNVMGLPTNLIYSMLENIMNGKNAKEGIF